MTVDYITPVPTISLQGWVTDAKNKLDTLMADFFVADYNQTQLFRGQVSSLQRILQQNGWKTNGSDVQIKGTLSNYLSRYFDQASVEVSILNEDTTYGTSFTLRIDIEIVDKGYTRTDSWAVDSNNCKTSKVADLLNG